MFEVEVISSPGAALFPASPMWSVDLAALSLYDETLVKPLILFADRIALRSDREDMLDVVHAHGFQATRMPLPRFLKYMGLSLRRDPRELETLGVSMDLLAPPELARQILGERSDLDFLFKTWHEYESRVDEVGAAIRGLWISRKDQLDSKSLDLLRDRGILEVRTWTNGVSRADWYQDVSKFGEFMGEMLNESEHFQRIVDEVALNLSDSRGVLMADPGAALVLGTGQQSRPSPADIGISMVSRLPGLYDVEIAELIEIRDSLEPYLAPFRAAVINIEEEIAARTFDNARTSAEEVDRLWYKRVAPTTQEIAAQVRRGGYPRALLAAFTEDGASKVAAGATIAIASGSLVAGAIALIPAALAAGVPFVRALASKLEAQDTAKDNRLFFMYAAQEELKRRGAAQRRRA